MQSISRCPPLMLCLTVCVQLLSQIAMKQKMVAGDEEYQEPNRLVQTVLAGIVVTTVVLSVGTYLILISAVIHEKYRQAAEKGRRTAPGGSGEQLGVSRQTIIAIENDKYNPTLELAMKISRLLALHVDEIFFFRRLAECSSQNSGRSDPDLPLFRTFVRRNFLFIGKNHCIIDLCHKAGGRLYPRPVSVFWRK